MYIKNLLSLMVYLFYLTYNLFLYFQVENPEDSADIDSNKLEILERNKEMELLAKKSEKKAKSLLETHQKEQKKKKKVLICF